MEQHQIMKKKHAVFVPYPFQGQTNPMLHFARLLVADHGFTITFATNRHMYSNVQKQANSFNTMNMNHQDLIRVVCLDDGLPPDFDHKNVIAQPVVFRDATVHMMKAPLKHLLVSLLHPPCPAADDQISSDIKSFDKQYMSYGNYSKFPPAPSPTCVVVGTFCRTGYETAASLGLPVFMFWTQCAAVLSIYNHLPLLIQNGFFKGPKSDQESLYEQTMATSNNSDDESSHQQSKATSTSASSNTSNDESSHQQTKATSVSASSNISNDESSHQQIMNDAAHQESLTQLMKTTALKAKNLVTGSTDFSPDQQIKIPPLKTIKDNSGDGASKIVVSTTINPIIKDNDLNISTFVFNGDLNDEIINYIPGLPHIPRSSFPSFLTRLHNPNIPAERQFKFIIHEFENLKDYKGILLNTYTEIEGEICQALQQELHPTPLLPIGPILPSEFWQAAISKLANSDSSLSATSSSVGGGGGDSYKSSHRNSDEDSSILAWLDKKPQKSVLYIAFGTLLMPTKEDMASLIKGIKASKQPFLWVIRSASASAMDDDLRKQVDQLLNEVDGITVAWAPQLKVLLHPAVGGFLTHSGWNSTLESLSAGVPMITLPVFMDQPTNSVLVVDVLKTGLTLAHAPKNDVPSNKSDEYHEKQSNSNGGNDTTDSRAIMNTDNDDDQEMKSRISARFNSILKKQQLVHSWEDVNTCINELFHSQQTGEALRRRAALLSKAAIDSVHGLYGDSRSNFLRFIKSINDTGIDSIGLH